MDVSAKLLLLIASVILAKFLKARIQVNASLSKCLYYVMS